MKCDVCDGAKELLEFYEPEVGSLYLPCYRCDGEGRYSFWNYITGLFWGHVPVWFIEWVAEQRQGV